MAEAGCAVRDVGLPVDFRHSMQVFNTVRDAANSARDQSPDKVERAAAERVALREQWAAFFQDWDVLLCPVTNTTAIKHDHGPWAQRRITVGGQETNYWSMMKWPGLIIIADLPSTVVPVGHDPSGLPIGVQVVSAFRRDRTSLCAGSLLERCHTAFTPPPLAKL